MYTMPQADPRDTEPSRTPPGGFWYPVEEAGSGSAVEVLRAVRRFRVADLAMRNKARTDMDMNDSDLVALRHLIAAGERNETIGPKDLSVHLGITSAATAKLLSRLEGAGRLRREPHPSDRRAQVLGEPVVRRLLGAPQRSGDPVVGAGPGAVGRLQRGCRTVHATHREHGTTVRTTARAVKGERWLRCEGRQA